MACDNKALGYYTCEEGPSAGIANLWISAYSGGTMWSAGTNINEIVFSTGATPFYKVEIREGTANLKHDLVLNEDYGMQSFTQRMAFVIAGHSLSATTFANSITKSKLVIAVQLEQEGVIKILGTTGKSCVLKAGSADTGTKFNDPNIISLTWGAQVNRIAPQLSTAYANVLLPKE